MGVLVKTPSRLHLGIIDLNGGVGRIFGSIGVAIGYPNVILEASPSPELIISGEEVRYTSLIVNEFLESHNLEMGVRINVEGMIPRHVGLGSGTQLSLAIAASLARLSRLDYSTADLAKALGRGAVSGIGTAAFEHGGFIVDGGHRVEVPDLEPRLQGVPPTTFHHPFPDDWLFVVAIPKAGRGFSDMDEISAFRGLTRAGPESADRICRLTLMKMIPALVERDIEGFGDALTRVQRLVGENFRDAQGGRFANPISEGCFETMLNGGARGAGQSSWGPSIYGLVRGEREGERVKGAVEEYLDAGAGGIVFVAPPDNQGALIDFFEE